MTRTRALRCTAGLVAAAALALGTAACGGQKAQSSGGGGQHSSGGGTGQGSPDLRPVPVTGGRTTLRLDARATRALVAAGIRIQPVGGATGADGRFTFPITGGRIDVRPLSGRIEHRGGLRFRARGMDVTATDLVVRPRRGVLTAEVSGRRVPLFSLDLERRLDRATSTALAGPARLSPDSLPGLPNGVPDLRVGRIVVSAVS